MKNRVYKIEKLMRMYEFPQYLQVICNEYLENDIGADRVKKILEEYNIDSKQARCDLVHFLVEYFILDMYDEPLTTTDLQHAISFKQIFPIKPGDFTRFAKYEVDCIFMSHIRIVLSEEVATSMSPLSRFEVQSMFDLTDEELKAYLDSYAEFSEREKVGLDETVIFFGLDEYFRARERKGRG